MTREANFPHRARAFFEIGVGLVPMVYVAGFLAWSFYSARHGLGGLPLLTVQYVAVGGFFAVYLFAVSGLTWLLLSSYDKQAWSKWPATRSARWKRLFAMAGTLFVSYTAGAFLFTTAIGGLGLTLGGWQHLLVLAGAAAVASIVYVCLIAVLGLVDQGSNGDPEARGTLGRLEGDHWFIIYATIGLISLATFSMYVMPEMDPAYGGARVRVAALDIDPTDLSPSTMDRLWPDWNWSAGPPGIVQSPDVQVLFVHESSIWIRPIGEDPATGQPIEISRDLIHGITWRSS